MTFDWQALVVWFAVAGAVAYLAFTLWPRLADGGSAGCGSCASGCDADQIDNAAKPKAKPVVPIDQLLKKP